MTVRNSALVLAMVAVAIPLGSAVAAETAEDKIAYFYGSAALNEECRLFPGETAVLAARADALAQAAGIGPERAQAISGQARATALSAGCSGTRGQVRAAIDQAKKASSKSK